MAMSLIKDKAFDELVSRHLRTVTDNAPLTDEELDYLKTHLTEWWVTLVQLKKSAETQLAAKKAEIRGEHAQLRLGGRSAQAVAQAELDYSRWRTKNLRFKNVVETVLAEVAVLMEQERGGVFREILAEERNVLAGRVRELEDALIEYCSHIHGPDCEPVCPFHERLCVMVDMGGGEPAEDGDEGSKTVIQQPTAEPSERDGQP